MTPSSVEIADKFYVGCLISSGKGDGGGQFQGGK